MSNEQQPTWLRVTAEIIRDGEVLPIPDGGLATVSRQMRIDDMDGLAHTALPGMVERAFRFPGTLAAAPSPWQPGSVPA